ncbi:MAG: hypothetical protein CM15mP74_21580 [Halieaceae bacterium]|nr:MAG: hypothetical protein CM15mP74_21580 [Halieaceae bacterium]
MDLRHLDYRALGAVLTHSLSAYQTTEQAKTPRLIKALNVLYLYGLPSKKAAAFQSWRLLTPGQPR